MEKNRSLSSPEGKISLAKMMSEIEKNGFEMYISNRCDQEIDQAVDFYFDHLVPFVKMLGDDLEADVSKTMGQMKICRDMTLSENWNKTQPVLERAMNLLA
ncbi:hypothetical protein [uncultured Dubosiella sp.]|uniref:hypothetical protein n=1 Tax=uncultured Dubosiella sp. TaxID=1937011 RepID=UPI00261BA758|nr:hypothetical protein [uncultured Dubosiella sp.]